MSGGLSHIKTTLGAILLGCLLSTAYEQSPRTSCGVTDLCAVQTIGDDHRADVPLLPPIPEGRLADKAHGAWLPDPDPNAAARPSSDERSSQVIGIWFVLWSSVILGTPDDDTRLLDSTHAALMCASTWEYLIANFGNEEVADRIPM